MMSNDQMLPKIKLVQIRRVGWGGGGGGRDEVYMRGGQRIIAVEVEAVWK